MSARRPGSRGPPPPAEARTPGDRVRVYKDGRAVGVLTGDVVGQVTFAYDASVLDDPSAAVSLRLPVRPAPYPDHLAAACFENLLPEGDLRRALAVVGQFESVD